MKYAIGVIGFVVFALLFIIFLVTRTPSTSTDVQKGKKAVVLVNYADKDAKANYTIKGKVTAEEKRYAFRMTVGKSERVIEVLQGYDESVLRRDTFPNNAEAYNVFIRALDQAGYSREIASTIKDERGICPLGNRFVYELKQGNEQVFRNWGTTCGKQGTFGGNSSLVRQLFTEQFPSYAEVTKGVTL